MKGVHRGRASRPADSGELVELRSRLAEAEETLHAIRSGEADSLMVHGERGARVFTLEGDDYAYRELIESMNEGALTLTADDGVLYANRCFAGMVRSPLQRVIGGSFRQYLAAEDWARLEPLLKRADPKGSSIEVTLRARDRSRVPARISVRPLPIEGAGRATFGVVATDMTEARYIEELLRKLSHRLVQSQEVERARLALELHDHITQLLCAASYRCQALTAKLWARGDPSKDEAVRLGEMVGKASEEVERISQGLRPSVLEELGLPAVLRATSTAFAERTHVPVNLSRVRPNGRLPADIELALFRIFQEALRNVEEHARAGNVDVSLTRQARSIQLVIRDDGIGFDPERCVDRRRKTLGLGLTSMRERATSLRGTLRVDSARGAGTGIEVRIPLPRSATAAR